MPLNVCVFSACILIDFEDWGGTGSEGVEGVVFVFIFIRALGAFLFVLVLQTGQC